MKINMKIKKIFNITVFLFSFTFLGNAQEKVVMNGDTLIQITPKHLSTINGIIENFEWTKKENNLLKEAARIDSTRLALKDSIIVVQEQREKKKEAYYIEQATQLATQNVTLSNQNEKLATENKKAKKKAWFAGGAGGILGIIIGILIML